MSDKNTTEAYSRSARKYEIKWKKYLDHTHSKLLAEFESTPKDKILDVSAGTGLFAEHLIEAGFGFRSMTLNDVSAGMLKLARDRFSEKGSIHFHCDYAEELSFEPNSFDVVVSMNAFHNYAGQEEALEQVQRILKPGGHFYLLDWNRSGFFRVVNRLIKLSVPEIINTRSASEAKEMAEGVGLKVESEQEWSYRYWKFFLIRASNK